MKPIRSILDESFRYVPAASTSVAETWRRFGWRPMTDDERKTRSRPAADVSVIELVVDEVSAVTPFRRRIALVQNTVEQQPPLLLSGSTG